MDTETKRVLGKIALVVGGTFLAVKMILWLGFLGTLGMLLVLLGLYLEPFDNYDDG